MVRGFLEQRPPRSARWTKASRRRRSASVPSLSSNRVRASDIATFGALRRIRAWCWLTAISSSVGRCGGARAGCQRFGRADRGGGLPAMGRERLRPAGRILSARDLGSAAGQVAPWSRCARASSSVLSPQPQALWFGSNVLALSESGWVSNRPNRVSLALAACCTGPPPVRRSSRTFGVCARAAICGHPRSDDPRTAVLQSWLATTSRS